MASIGPALLSHWLLRGVSRTQLQPLVANAQQIRFLPDELIFEEGDNPDGLYLITVGTVRVTAGSEQGGTLLATIGADDILGEMGVLDGQPRSGRATALGPCTAYFVPMEAFLDCLERSPRLCMRLLGLLTQRLRLANEPLKRYPHLPSPDDPLGLRGPKGEPSSSAVASDQPAQGDYWLPTQAPKEFFAPETASFSQWLVGHIDWEDPVGDLARFAHEDPEWPHDADSSEALHTHLDHRHAPSHIQAALTTAWRMWELRARLLHPGATFDTE